MFSAGVLASLILFVLLIATGTYAATATPTGPDWTQVIEPCGFVGCGPSQTAEPDWTQLIEPCGVVGCGSSQAPGPDLTQVIEPGGVTGQLQNGQCGRQYQQCESTRQTNNAQCENNWRSCVSQKCQPVGSGSVEQCRKDADCESSCTEDASSQNGLLSCCLGGPQHNNSCPTMIDGKCSSGQLPSEIHPNPQPPQAAIPTWTPPPQQQPSLTSQQTPPPSMPLPVPTVPAQTTSPISNAPMPLSNPVTTTQTPNALSPLVLSPSAQNIGALAVAPLPAGLAAGTPAATSLITTIAPYSVTPGPGTQATAQSTFFSGDFSQAQEPAAPQSAPTLSQALELLRNVLTAFLDYVKSLGGAPS